MEIADRMKGDGQAVVELQLPMIKDVPKERVKTVTSIAISNASLPNAMQGIDITEGDFKVTMGCATDHGGGPRKAQRHRLHPELAEATRQGHAHRRSADRCRCKDA